MTIDETVAILTESARENGLKPEVVAAIVADLKRAAGEEKEERKRTAGKKAKHQFVVLAIKPESGQAEDTLGFVLQIEEGASPAVVTDRIQAAANAFNGSKRGRKVPVKTIGQCLESVPAKWYKTANPLEVTRVKTRTAVLVKVLESNELAT